MARVAMRTSAKKLKAFIGTFAVFLGFIAASLILSGCGEERKAAFDSTGNQQQDTERQVLLATIQRMAAGKDLKNPDHVVAFHKAVDDLIARGSAIETAICEALASDEDWGVRVGAVEVLKAIGTRSCIEALLGALEDLQPLVALNANYLLCELTKHSVIPAAGTPAVNGLPALPQRAPDQLELDAEEIIWAKWHAQHKVTLHQVWREWWTANKATVAIQ